MLYGLEWYAYQLRNINVMVGNAYDCYWLYLNVGELEACLDFDD